MIPRIGRGATPVLSSLLAMLIVLGALSCGGDGARDAEAGGGGRGTEAAGEADAAPGVPVEVARARIGEISSYLLLSSTVEAESRVDVYSQVTGLVESIGVEEGSDVRRGTILARLDDDEYALDAAAAEVKFRKMQNDFKRVEKMHADNLISGEAFENARYDLRQAELEWEKAKLRLEHTRIESPIDGIVSRRLLDVGERVTASTQIFSIVNVDSLIAVVYVPEREISRVAPRQAVRISSDVLPGGPVEAWVKRISPVVDPNSGTFKVTIGLHTPSAGLRPGMFVNVRIVTGTHTGTVLVPRDAVVYDGGREYLFLAGEDSTATRIELEKGFADNRIVEVLEGVTPRDRVIVVGQDGIKDGAKIQILGDRSDEGEGAAS